MNSLPGSTSRQEGTTKGDRSTPTLAEGTPAQGVAMETKTFTGSSTIFAWWLEDEARLQAFGFK